MKIQRQRIIFIIFFLISIIIGYLFWDLINLKFKDQGIIGQPSIRVVIKTQEKQEIILPPSLMKEF